MKAQYLTQPILKRHRIHLQIERLYRLTGTSLDNRSGQVEALGNVPVNATNGTVNNNGSN